LAGLSEDQLCHAFADQIKDSPAFVTWLLGRTKKFAKFTAVDVRVLWQEQKRKRTSPAAPWWRHWFRWPGCNCDGCVGGRETDIFVVFELVRSKERFALHIENKKSKGKFTPGQAAAYSLRAKCWANSERYLNYSDYETILVAPSAFFGEPGAELFTRIPYEDVAKVLPCYG
jgi:hypothetical protein